MQRTRWTTWLVPVIGALLLATQSAPAQFGTDWTTPGFDAQRSSWVRLDAKISPAHLAKPGFKMVWKRQLDNTPRQLESLTSPALFDYYIGYRGFRSLAFLGGSSGRIFVLDTDLARMEWDQDFGFDSSTEGTLDCPGGMTANVTRATPTGLPLLIPPRGSGRRSPASSAVGKPTEGAVTLKLGPRRSPGSRRPGPKTKRQRPLENPYGGKTHYLYALAPDGMLRASYVSNGDTDRSALRFLGPAANARGLIVVNDVAYVATTNGCGDVPDGVWALDLESKKVIHWEANSAMAGFGGPVFGPGGTLYAAAAGEGSAVVSLDPKTLKLMGRYTPKGAGLTSSPVVIDHQESDLLAVTDDAGRIHLLRGASLDGPAYRSPVYSESGRAPNALSTWRDNDGVVWLLAPSHGSASADIDFPVTNGEVSSGALTAWKVVDRDGAPALEPGWVSRDLVSPVAPTIVNGVVFALSSGEFRTEDSSMSAAERVRRSSPAVLYALDGATGKVLWESGDSISSFARGMPFSAGVGYVYLVTHDGTLYSFGFPMEH